MLFRSHTHTHTIIGNPNLTLRQVFWDIWAKKKYQLPSDTSKCYIFELLSQPIKSTDLTTVPHWSNIEGGDDAIYLTGIRCLNSYSLLPFDETERIAAASGWWTLPRIRHLKTTADLADSSRGLLYNFFNRRDSEITQRGLLRGYVLRLDTSNPQAGLSKGLEETIFVAKSPQFIAALNLRVKPDASMKMFEAEEWGWHKVHYLFVCSLCGSPLSFFKKCVLTPSNSK